MKRHTRVCLAFLAFSILGPASAAAQPGMVNVVPPPPPPVEETAPPAQGIDSDALLDRAWLTPTAMTQPKGAFKISYLQLPAPIGVVTATYGVTDKLHLTGIYIHPYDEEGGVYSLGAKIQVVNRERTRVAVMGGLSSFNDGYDAVRSAQVGAAFSRCLDPSCHSLISAFVGAVFVDDTDERPTFVSASYIGKLGRKLRFVAEIDHGFVPDDPGDSISGAFYGLRWTSNKWAADLGLLQPFGELNDMLPMGLPLASLSYRAR